MSSSTPPRGSSRVRPRSGPAPSHEVGASGGGVAGPELGTLLRRGAKAALARWVLQKRRQRRDPDADAWPTPQDEATHDWDGRRYFAEDYTFAGAQAGLGIVARLEWLPGRGVHRIWLTLLRGGPGDGRVHCLPAGQLLRSEGEGDRWRAGGMIVDCRTPLRQWTVRFSGQLQTRPSGPIEPAGEAGGPPVLAPPIATQRCSVDLTFDADGPAFSPGRDDDPELLAQRLGEASWDGKLLSAVRREQNRGYVQLGRLEGSVSLGDELIPLRAQGFRAHSWGVLDWGGPDAAFQCFWVEPSGERAWVHHERFPFVTLEGGFVDHRGRRATVRRLAATFERRPRRAPARATLGIEAETPLEAELQVVADTAFVVDGRGLVELGLVQTANGGVGLWGGQRRTLPRR